MFLMKLFQQNVASILIHTYVLYQHHLILLLPGPAKGDMNIAHYIFAATEFRLSM